MTLLSAPPGFGIPDFNAPLDIAALLAAVPSTATFKGTIAQSTIETLKRAGKPAPKSYVVFRDYPMKELMELNVDAAKQLFPDQPLREGVRRLGRSVFPTFTQTLLGKVMYGVFGGNPSAVLKLANKSYDMTQNTGRVTTLATSSRSVTLRFSSTYTILSSYHYGILEGTLQALGFAGLIGFHPLSEIDGEFFVAWEPRLESVAQP